METIIKKITDNEIENDKIIKTAAEIISRGGLVAVSYTHLTLPTIA